MVNYKDGISILGYERILDEVQLFNSIHDNELQELLSCLGSKKVAYNKGDYLWSEGEKVTNVGILLKGKLQIHKDEATGNRSILSEINPSNLFGEAFVCAGLEKSPVSVLAVDNCEVLFIQIIRILTVCSSACVFHSKLIANLLKIIAQKNIILNNKIRLLSHRSIREKLLHYFYLQIEDNKQVQFTIPFSRYELADYLCVDRSALSRELGRMRDEGLITYNKNRFNLNKNLYGGGANEQS